VPGGILVSPSIVVVPANLTSSQQFEAVIAGTGKQAVTWSVPSAGGSITQNGSYTPSTNSGNAPVAVTVTATSQSNPSEQGTALVVLMDSGTTAGGVGVSPQVASLGPTQTQQFTCRESQ
jgi:hypothetical protein